MPDLKTSVEPREKPEIISEEDRPFLAKPSANKNSDDIPSLIKLKDQQHSHEVEDFKNSIGKTLLYGCLIAILLFGIVDAVFHVDAPMFTSSFEVIKMVATTVLGYLFGSKSKS